MPAPELSDKYIVFKIEEWDAFAQANWHRLSKMLVPEPLGDCFVLRSQDVFSSSALHGYAHVIQAVLEVDAAIEGSLTQEQRDQFGWLADAVEAKALEWQGKTGRLPD